MMFIVFRLGEDRYALDAREVVEVLPLVRVKRLPLAPPGVAGVLDYRGAPVPVIDLSELTLRKPAGARISTRILIVNAGPGQVLGLIAEHANGILRREPADFVDAGVAVDEAPYLGRVTRDDRGLVQWITPDKLFPGWIRDALFRQVAEAA